MPVHHQLPHARDVLERSEFEVAIVVRREVFEDFPAENEKAAVDQPLAFHGFFMESLNAVPVCLQLAETRSGINPGDRCDFPVAHVNRDQLADVDIGNSVSVSQHKGVCLDELFHPFQAGPLQSLLSRVGQGDAPACLVVAVVDVDALRLSQYDGEIAIHELVVTEVVLDHFPFVTEGQDEIIAPVPGLDFHDVLENRPIAYMDHGFGAEICFLPEPGPHASAKNYYLHFMIHV